MWSVHIMLAAVAAVAAAAALKVMVEKYVYGFCGGINIIIVLAKWERWREKWVKIFLNLGMKLNGCYRLYHVWISYQQLYLKCNSILKMKMQEWIIE